MTFRDIYSANKLQFHWNYLAIKDPAKASIDGQNQGTFEHLLRLCFDFLLYLNSYLILDLSFIFKWHAMF